MTLILKLLKPIILQKIVNSNRDNQLTLNRKDQQMMKGGGSKRYSEQSQGIKES